MDSRRGSESKRPQDRSGDNPSSRDLSGNNYNSSSSAFNTSEIDQPDVLKIGDTIGGTYLIKSLLGRGGMGQVFAVEHLMLRQTYALKILTADSPSNTNWRRFQTEARSIAKLDHLNIIKVHNLGIHNEKVPYYVMELLQGDSLSALIKEGGPLKTTEVIDIFLPLCEGLAYAHSHGIIHRDIKPSNIMLVEQNHKLIPKLVDFGLVKLVGNALSPSQQLTATGEVFGSPLYMSPEQSVGRHVSERTDIYSLGCAMFESLTGAPPFVGENIVQTIMKHQNEAPPTLKEASMGEDFTPEWEAVIARTLTKEASDRYQTMNELATDLRAIKAGKKLSKHFATTGDGDLFSDEIANGNVQSRYNISGVGRVVAISCAGLAIFLLGGGSAAFFYLKYGKDKVGPTHVDSLSMGGIQKEIPVRQNAELDKELDNYAKPFVKNDGFPDGKKTFEFPKGESIGDLAIAPADPTAKAQIIEAKGSVTVPVAARITFEAGNVCGNHPKIFRKFNRDDLQAIVLPSTTSDTDDELYFLNHMTQICILNVGGTDITATGLKTIGEMPVLSCLYLPKTNNLTGLDLASLKNLKRLAQINFSGGKDVTSLLKALSGSQAIGSLTLDQTKLTAEDIKIMTTMPNLETVSFTDCHLTEKELAPLNKLPKLQRMLLRGNDLSPQFIDTFKESPSLSWIELCKPSWEAADLARFDQIFKLRYHFRALPSNEM